MPVGGFRTPTAVDTGSARRPCLCGGPRHKSGSEGRRHILPESLDGRHAVASDSTQTAGPVPRAFAVPFDEPAAGRVQEAAQRGACGEDGTPNWNGPDFAVAASGVARKVKPAVRYGGVGDEHVILDRTHERPT